MNVFFWQCGRYSDKPPRSSLSLELKHPFLGAISSTFSWSQWPLCKEFSTKEMPHSRLDSPQEQPISSTTVGVDVQRCNLLATILNTSDGVALQSSTGLWWGPCWKYINIYILPLPIPKALTLLKELLALPSAPAAFKCQSWSLFPGRNDLLKLVLGNIN